MTHQITERKQLTNITDQSTTDQITLQTLKTIFNVRAKGLPSGATSATTRSRITGMLSSSLRIGTMTEISIFTKRHPSKRQCSGPRCSSRHAVRITRRRSLSKDADGRDGLRCAFVLSHRNSSASRAGDDPDSSPSGALRRHPRDRS